MDLDIAERLHKRQPYNVIAKELRVSAKTISKVSRLVNCGAIRIGKDGKAFYVEAEAAETKPRASPQICGWSFWEPPTLRAKTQTTF